jgi:hypothetical protein
VGCPSFGGQRTHFCPPADRWLSCRSPTVCRPPGKRHPVLSKWAARPSAVSAPTSAHGKRLGIAPFLKRSVLPDARCTPASARAVRPLAASEPVFARHRHHLRSSKHRALWIHRHRSSTLGVSSRRQFRWSTSGAQSSAPSDLPFRLAAESASEHNCSISSLPPNTRAVLPNPSFNLTRSGLRPPRAS